MMISPEAFILSFQDESYEKCIQERDRLIHSIRRFEKRRINTTNYVQNPSPDVVYQCELEYLSKLCELIAKKYQSLREDVKCIQVIRKNQKKYELGYKPLDWDECSRL